MTTNQLFFALLGVIFSAATFFKYYLDAKIDPMQAQLKMLVDYMVLHQGKISALEERTKNL
jgi:hypothetical protein